MDELTDERLSSKGDSQNMFVDRLIQYRISPRPKTAEKRGFCTGVTDGRTDGPTDRPSYRDARTHLKITLSIFTMYFEEKHACTFYIHDAYLSVRGNYSKES